MSKKHVERVFKKATKRMSQQHHPNCGATTDIIPKVIHMAVLDPWHFIFKSSDCAGCGEAPLSEVCIRDGRSLLELFKEMQRAVPLSGKIFRFIGIPILGSLLAVLLGPPFVWMVSDEKIKDWNSLILICACAGLFLGVAMMGNLFSMVRGWGLFWDEDADKQIWTSQKNE